MSKLFNALKIIIPVAIITLAISYVSADWTPPSSAPTGGNVPAPINAGSISQDKLGALRLNTAIPGSTYGIDVYGISRFFGNLQIGTDALHATIQIKDGNQALGKVLTSDADGLASWQTVISTGGSGITIPDIRAALKYRPSTTAVSYVQASTPVNFSASCGASEKVVGGGCSQTNGLTFPAVGVYSRPNTAGTGWECSVVVPTGLCSGTQGNGSCGSGDYIATAICI